MTKKTLFLFICVALSTYLSAQFAPAAGQLGSTAIHKDSSVFVAWATGINLQRGTIDNSVEGSELASTGSAEMALGSAGDGVVSLGDGGSAILAFDCPIYDGEGWDFAVFENAFLDTYLELGFVEVSSDGVHFVRFPAVSRTPTDVQVDNFGAVDPTHIHNLAGKYRAMYGTPFDLSDLVDSANIDLQFITHIRIVDCVGSINPNFGTKDSEGNFINDPWPTPFPSCGFDLDAVGVIHCLIGGLTEKEMPFKIYPNPGNEWLNIDFGQQHDENQVIISDLKGKIWKSFSSTNSSLSVNTANFPSGMYCIHIQSKHQKHQLKWVKQN